MDEGRRFSKPYSVTNTRHLAQIIVHLLLDLKFYYHNNQVLCCFPTRDFCHPFYNKHLVRAKISGLPTWLMSQQTPFQNPNSPHQRQHAQHHAASPSTHHKQIHTDFALLQNWLLREGTSQQKMLSIAQLPLGRRQFLLIQADRRKYPSWKVPQGASKHVESKVPLTLSFPARLWHVALTTVFCSPTWPGESADGREGLALLPGQLCLQNLLRWKQSNLYLGAPDIGQWEMGCHFEIVLF